MADRVEQLLEGGVGVDRQGFGGPDVGHPGLHVLAGDAHEVRAVVDAQPVGVDLVHQIAALAGVQPLGDHRLIADREPDQHVEMLGALASRGGGQEPAVRDRPEPHQLQRLMGVGGGVGVSERLVGDQQMPGDHLQVGGIPVKHPVRDEHHARAVAECGVERADLPGDRPALVDDQHLDVGRQRWQPAAGRAACELVVPLAEQPALGNDHRPQPTGRRGPVGERSRARHGFARSNLSGVDAGADDLQRRHVLLAAEQHRVIGERASQSSCAPAGGRRRRASPSRRSA